jgi:prepilin-type N-terminal cleavage/methylation domain-containing protein
VLNFGRKKGFTLIELLVVIAIIALLLSILLPSLSKAKLVARKIECQSNMKNLVITQTLFAQGNDGYFAKNTGIYPDYVKNSSSPKENIHTALYSYGIGKLTVCKIYASYFRQSHLGDPAAVSPNDPAYGGWDSPATEIDTPYYWFANLKRYETDSYYGPPKAMDGGKSPWANRVSDASSMTAMMTHRINVVLLSGVNFIDPSNLPLKGHGWAEVNLKFEMPVAYGDGHLETHKRNEIKARGKMKTSWGESVFAY